MTLSLDYIRKKMGWCPNARTMCTAPLVITTPPVTIHPAQPDGGSGSGPIGRGATLAFGSLRILFRNRQLLWFSLLAGLVMIFSLVSSLYLQFISGTLPLPGTNLMTGPATALIAAGSVTWIILTFITGLVTTFLTYYLLTALIACMSRILSGAPMTVRYGLVHAGSFLRPLGIWSTIWALFGTVYFFFQLSSMTPGGSMGNLGLTFAGMVIIAVCYVLTMFVIPLLVLGNDSLGSAVVESVSLFRKIWREIVTCLISLFVIAFIILFITLIPIIALAFPSGSTAAVSVFVVAYLLVMLVLLFIGSTVLGIAITGLYTYGKTGTLSAMFEGKPAGVENAS